MKFTFMGGTSRIHLRYRGLTPGPVLRTPRQLPGSMPQVPDSPVSIHPNKRRRACLLCKHLAILPDIGSRQERPHLPSLGVPPIQIWLVPEVALEHLKGTNILQAQRPPNLSASIVSNDYLRPFAPRCSWRCLLHSLIRRDPGRRDACDMTDLDRPTCLPDSLSGHRHASLSDGALGSESIDCQLRRSLTVPLVSLNIHTDHGNSVSLMVYLVHSGHIPSSLTCVPLQSYQASPSFLS